MANAWMPAPEVETIGRGLILEHHEHLSDVRVDFLFNYEPDKVRGREALATARKVTGLHAYHGRDTDDQDDWLFPDEFFLVSVWKKGWDDLSEAQKRALVDHELCHCIVKDSKHGPVLSTIGHDVEEFFAIVRRHGLWMPQLQRFIADARSGQTRLLDGDQPVNGRMAHLEVIE